MEADASPMDRARHLCRGSQEKLRAMICYHGGPITPNDVAVKVWTNRHALVSYAWPGQIELAAEVSRSFVIDNGAFSAWTQGEQIDVCGYLSFVDKWHRHPGFAWCLIPDVIDGDENDNAELINQWGLPEHLSVPVWHMHESLPFLDELCTRFPRVALGSSGDYATPGVSDWWDRIAEAMDVVCDSSGRPRAKLHGLRMMNPTIFSHVPFSSVDSCNVARNHGDDNRWDRSLYVAGMSKSVRAIVLAERIEAHASASHWAGRHTQMSLELIG